MSMSDRASALRALFRRAAVVLDQRRLPAKTAWLLVFSALPALAWAARVGEQGWGLAVVSAASQTQTAVPMAAHVDEFRLPSQMRTTEASRVEGIDADANIDAHRLWTVKLRDAIEQRDKADTATLSRDGCCALGKWMDGDGQRLPDRPTFTEPINRGEFRQAEDTSAPETPFAQATASGASCRCPLPSGRGSDWCHPLTNFKQPQFFSLLIA